MADSSRTLLHLLLKLLLLAIIGGGSYLLILYACLDKHPDSNNYNAAQMDKLQLLANTKQPRLIIIGGSNLAFGLDSERLEKALNINTANIGHQASLGLHYMMDTVRQFARCGDYVLLVPEYEHLGQDIFYGGSAIIELAGYTGNPYLLRYNGAVGLLAANTSIRNYHKATSYYPPYTRKSFNRHGDMVGHLDLPAAGRVVAYTISPVVNPAPIRQIKNFSIECNKRGVHLLVGYPAAMRSFYETNKLVITKLSDNLNRSGIPLLTPDPAMFVFDDHYFFDTVYHLHTKGRILRTERLISMLKEHGWPN